MAVTLSILYRFAKFFDSRCRNHVHQHHDEGNAKPPGTHTVVLISFPIVADCTSLQVVPKNYKSMSKNLENQHFELSHFAIRTAGDAAEKLNRLGA